MAKKSTTEDFIQKARLVHGDKYDYSKVKYVNDRTEVCIICPIHGDFWQTPRKHLSKHGCHICAIESRKRLKYGVATNDMLNQEATKCYAVWDGMLQRCYGGNRHIRNPSYLDCRVCDEWLLYSNFKNWFDSNYIEGYELDKDALGGEQKIYSPTTCTFIPKRLNSILSSKDRRGQMTGVMINPQSYAVSTTIDGEHFYIGGFHTAEEAHRAYIKLKKDRIFKVATEYWENKDICNEVFLSISIKLMEEYYNIAVKRVQEAIMKSKNLFNL